MINIVASSAILSINIPELYWGFQDDVCDIAGLYFPCGLVLYVDEMSMVHSMQTILYPGLHFKSHLPGCLFLK